MNVYKHSLKKGLKDCKRNQERVAQQNTKTRLWAERGSRPRVVKQQQFEHACLFGSECPARGIGQAMVVPWVNKNIMVEYLKQISTVTEKGRHAVVIMDGEGWHTNDIAEPFDNVSIIKLPPYSPELNPIEQVWSGLRQHYLANTSFADYESIVSKVCRLGIVFGNVRPESDGCAREDG
ncbi:IS630 family transposase [Vibrio vulnificus]|nr:IS630 family transposase [Vibrio vulnificus]RZP71549.1 IS630 family transposase [Vibrio vulnificus]RZP71621.1 IS630 family transposase [Vibrio vulnificus]